MSRQYSEHAPAACQRPRVECLWTSETATPGTHRVLPDGCIDLMYSVKNGHSSLHIIGAMTTFADILAGAGHRILAVRFHPAGLSGFAPCGEWTNQSIDLAAVSPRDARWLTQQLDDVPTVDTMSRIATGIVARLPAPDPAQRAIAHIAAHHGQVGLDWVAGQANLSSRQFRRICLARTGLTPKQLARIVRFRHAHTLCAAAARTLTDIALECGYFDQAHFIHDFQEYAGATPSRLRSTTGI